MSSQSILLKQKLLARLFVAFARTVFMTFFRSRQKIALANLQRSSLGMRFPEEHGQSLIKESLNHLALTLYHSLARILGLKSQILRKPTRSEAEDLPHFLDSLGVKIDSKVELKYITSQKRGLIFVSAHIGAWEELIHLGTVLERKTFVLSRRMKVKTMQRLWDRSRREFLPRMDQGSRAKFIVNTLNTGGAIADVLDQHSASHKAITCQFLGRSAATSSDLSRYALLSDALIIPIFLLRVPQEGRYDFCLHIRELIDPKDYLIQGFNRKECIEKITQALCDHISEVIKLYPEQWLWIHRRWKLD